MVRVYEFLTGVVSKVYHSLPGRNGAVPGNIPVGKTLEDCLGELRHSHVVGDVDIEVKFDHSSETKRISKKAPDALDYICQHNPRRETPCTYSRLGPDVGVQFLTYEFNIGKSEIKRGEPQAHFKVTYNIDTRSPKKNGEKTPPRGTQAANPAQEPNGKKRGTKIIKPGAAEPKISELLPSK